MASDYFAHEQQQRAAAQLAWKDFRSTLPKEQRRKVDGLPTPEIKRQKDDENGELPVVDIENSISSSCVPDLAGEIDKLEDVLMDRFGLSADQAGPVAKWHSEVVRREAELAKAERLARIVGVLIRPMHDVRAVICGLTLAAGITGQTALHEASSGADLARKLGKHRATVSYWKRSWQKLLDLHNETFGKSDAAKAKYSEERRRVVNEQRNGTWQPKKA